MNLLETAILFVQAHWISLISVLISVLISSICSLIIARKYSKPQAELAKDERKIALEEQLAQHYQKLSKWFFEQVAERLGNGFLDENEIFDGTDDYLKNLIEISEGDEFKPYWLNGLKHLQSDNPECFELINSLRRRMEDVKKETNALNSLIEKKITKAILDAGISTKNYPLSPGEVDGSTFLQLTRARLTNQVRRCYGNAINVLDCLKNGSSLDLTVSADGYVVLVGTAFARISPELSTETIKALFDSVEKDEELLKEIIRIRNSRIELRDDIKKVTDVSKQIIRKIGTGAYNTRASCCPK